MATVTQTRTVLVVDDDVDMQFLLGMYITEAGCEVAGKVGDGRQAVDAWRAHRENGRPLDVIVLDQMMPGVTGLEAATEIREHDSEVMIILVSAAMSSGLADAARSIGITHALSKNDLRTLTSTLAV